MVTHLKMRLTYNLQSDRHIIFQIISRYGGPLLWSELCTCLKSGAGHIKFKKKKEDRQNWRPLFQSRSHQSKSESRLKYCLWNLKHCIRFSISSERAFSATNFSMIHWKSCLTNTHPDEYLESCEKFRLWLWTVSYELPTPNSSPKSTLTLNEAVVIARPV